MADGQLEGMTSARGSAKVSQKTGKQASKQANELLNVAMLLDPAAIGDWSVDPTLIDKEKLEEIAYLNHQVPQGEQ